MAISTATVKAYVDTGFDANNIPDSPSLLQSAAARVVTLDTLNCLPLDGKDGGSITVKAFADLPKTDYLSLYFPQDGITYYATGLEYEYVTLDTVVISFVIDGWLTAGGLANISAVSGLTKRHHVTDDTFGNYTMPDEMLVPSKSLKCAYTRVLCDTTPSTQPDLTVVVSTIDLFILGQQDTNGDYVWAADAGIDYTSDNNVCCVPIVPNISEEQFCTIKILGFSDAATAFVQPGVAYFNGNDETVQRGIAMARSLGVEDSILYQYTVPGDYIYDVHYYVDQTAPAINYGSSLFSSITSYGGSNFFVPVISGSGSSANIGLEYDTVMNNRVLTGDLNAYHLVAVATGEEISVNPEEWAPSNILPPIFPASITFDIGVKPCFDPRPTGRPMYHPILKNTPAESYVSSVRGEQWASAPIKYQQASGIDLTVQKFNNSLALAKGELELNQMMSGVNAAAGIFGGGYVSAANSRGGTSITPYSQSYTKITPTIPGTVAPSGIPGAGGYIGGGAGINVNHASGGMSSSIPFVSGLVNAGVTGIQEQVNSSKYYMERAAEKAAFYMDSMIVAPQLNFPRSETVRDIIGNGFMLWRTYLDPDDVDRLDIILNMYGYKDIKKLEKSDFTNRQYYNYVEAGDVKITYTNAVNKRIRQLAQRQVEAGIRVWHRRCNTSLFSQVNPVTT